MKKIKKNLSFFVVGDGNLGMDKMIFVEPIGISDFDTHNLTLTFYFKC